MTDVLWTNFHLWGILGKLEETPWLSQQHQNSLQMHMCTHLSHPPASSVHWVQYETHLATSGVRNFPLIVQGNSLTSFHKSSHAFVGHLTYVYFDRVSLTAVFLVTSLLHWLETPLGPYHVVLSLGQVTIWQLVPSELAW